ncbi:MAG: hypothetical protein HY996_04200 [Micrococcales bacterium]|nr:hypothetical protein [Micrococcales bacterium]
MAPDPGPVTDGVVQPDVLPDLPEPRFAKNPALPLRANVRIIRLEQPSLLGLGNGQIPEKARTILHIRSRAQNRHAVWGVEAPQADERELLAALGFVAVRAAGGKPGVAGDPG